MATSSRHSTGTESRHTPAAGFMFTGPPFATYTLKPWRRWAVRLAGTGSHLRGGLSHGRLSVTADGDRGIRGRMCPVWRLRDTFRQLQDMSEVEHAHTAWLSVSWDGDANGLSDLPDPPHRAGRSRGEHAAGGPGSRTRRRRGSGDHRAPIRRVGTG